MKNNLSIIIIMAILILYINIDYISAQEFGSTNNLTETEKNALFDIFVDIPLNYKNIELNKEIIFSIRLVNLGSSGRIDVILNYGILDADKKIILSKRETVAVETQANFVRDFHLVEIPSGDYTLFAVMEYADGKTAESENSFKILARVAEFNYLILSIIAIIVILGMLVYKLRTVFRDILIRIKVREIVHRQKEN